MKRDEALALLRYAGYHDDSGRFARLYTENRISYAVAMTQWRAGAAMRRDGVKCTCSDCKGREFPQSPAMPIKNETSPLERILRA